MLIAFALMTVVAAPDPTAIVQPCSPLSADQFDAAVSSIMDDPNRVRAMEPAGDLLWNWRNRCPITDRSSRLRIAQAAARLLDRAELRSQAAWVLYQLGSDARIVRDKIHWARRDQERRVAAIYRFGDGNFGPAPSTRDALQCLDETLRGRHPTDKVCASFQRFDEWQRKPKSELE